MGAAVALPVVGPVAMAAVSSTNLEDTTSCCLPVVTSPSTRNAGCPLPEPNALLPSGYGVGTRRRASDRAGVWRLSGYALDVTTWQPAVTRVALTTVVTTSPTRQHNIDGGRQYHKLATPLAASICGRFHQPPDQNSGIARNAGRGLAPKLTGEAGFQGGQIGGGRLAVAGRHEGQDARQLQRGAHCIQRRGHRGARGACTRLACSIARAPATCAHHNRASLALKCLRNAAAPRPRRPHRRRATQSHCRAPSEPHSRRPQPSGQTAPNRGQVPALEGVR